MSDHAHGVSGYFKVFGVLIGLTILTVVSARIDLGILNLPLALLIAGSKATVVVLFFMHVKESPKLIQLFVVCGTLWLLVLLGVTICDYLTRSWDEPNHHSWITRSASHFEAPGH